MIYDSTKLSDCIRKQRVSEGGREGGRERASVKTRDAGREAGREDKEERTGKSGQGRERW